jgi:hypothetical protein
VNDVFDRESGSAATPIEYSALSAGASITVKSPGSVTVSRALHVLPLNSPTVRPPLDTLPEITKRVSLSTN